MFIMQSFSFSFCCNEIRTLIQWFLNTFSFNESTHFFSFRFLSSPVATQEWSSNASSSYWVICSSSHPTSDKDMRYFVIVVPSFQNGVVTTMLGSASFLQHLLGLAVHSFPFGGSMFGTMGEILFDDVRLELIRRRSSSCPTVWSFARC